MVKPIPDNYHSITPYLAVDDAAEAIDWYSDALGATELMRYEHEDRVAHAEIRIGDSVIMLADESPDVGHVSPRSQGGTSVSLMLYVDDVDSVFARAIDEGATEQRAVVDQIYGDRSGTLVDPFGHRWHIATHVEDVSEDEMRRRMESATEQPQTEAV